MADIKYKNAMLLMQSCLASKETKMTCNKASIISFREAIDSTDGQNRNLLIGNGFSAEYFKYSNLFVASDLEKTSPVYKLFEKLGTHDFELVIRALDNATIVAESYGWKDQGETLKEAARSVRLALVRAVNETHPDYRKYLNQQKYDSATRFLKKPSNN